MKELAGVPTPETKADIGGADLLAQIHEALEIVHSPHSTNDSRKQASAFLENLKSDESAPYHGFTLAIDRNQQFVVRHYALSLLEYALKHRWSEYSNAQADTLRGWVLQLAETISTTDPLYLRNKIAQLWVEISKRSWGEEWMDMDECLVKLWQLPDSMAHKDFVLFVLETLSEDVFNGEDTTAAMREVVLNKACVEIFTASSVLEQSFPNRQIVQGIRSGEEGWLVRVGHLLENCLSNMQARESPTTAKKCLAVFRSAMSWVPPAAIIKAECVKHLCSSVTAPNVPVQMAALDTFNALYLRSHFSDTDFLALICPLYRSENVVLLRNIFDWTMVDANDIDDEKYSLGKKLSEMLSLLGNFIEQKISAIPEDCDLPKLLNLFLSVCQSESFVVSIPVLVTWTRLLKSETIGASPTVTPLVGPLLELCSLRLVRYESLPEDSNDPCLIFLLEDIDTIPERHAFLGNYRRYCTQVIELIVRRRRADAIYHILNQVAFTMEHLYQEIPPFSAEKYSKTSIPLLRVDAQFTVVEAALKGYMKLRDQKLQDNRQEKSDMESTLASWCERLLGMEFGDPIIRKRVLQLAAAFSTSALKKNSEFMLKVLESILTTRPQAHPEYLQYTEAVNELQSESSRELTRLATKMPDQLMEIYPQLESKVNEILAAGPVDSKQQLGYQEFLFTIVHRASRLDPAARLQQLEVFTAPIKQLWQQPELDQSLESLDSFCNLLGLKRAREYMAARRVWEVSDWATMDLDAEGELIKADLEARVKALPLRPTKIFFCCSTDHVEGDSEIWKTSCALWGDSIPLILPALLKFLSHAHAFYNPANWTDVPVEMQSVVNKIMTDRFWQAGISQGTREEFYARVTNTTTSMDGLGSTLRRSIRSIRDASYNILFAMKSLGIHFFGLKELPGPLAHALFADAYCLSSHQLINMLHLTRHLVTDCNIEVRSHFVPPILATCFTQMDAKISSEWERLGKMQQDSSENEDLTYEMKDESILRQLTHTVVMLVAGFLDPAAENPTTHPSTNKEASTYHPNSNGTVPNDRQTQYPTMRQFCLSSTSILEPLLLFSTHAIRFRDTRCCGVILRVLRSVIPEFNLSDETNASIREFISTEVLKACITSLNEPYFVDLHKELAQVIATILLHYCPLTDTPRQILLGLPGLDENSVNKCIEYLRRLGTATRQQRAIVLDLLADLKGVSISEQGRITKSAGTVRKEISKMQQEFMKVQDSEPTRQRQASPDLDGVAGMFDG